MEKTKLHVIKIGGNIIDNPDALNSFLTNFALIPGFKILVHGGGKLATSLASELGVAQTMVEGRRITDEATLKIVTMVYAGYINKNIVT
jgi:acetylglutamate kinase